MIWAATAARTKLLQQPRSRLPYTSRMQSTTADSERRLVQYIVMRRDLYRELGWPLGSLVAQGCHASVAAVWTSKDDQEVQAYCGPESLDRMTKVVLEVKGETQLRTLSKKLEDGGIHHKLWIEQVTSEFINEFVFILISDYSTDPSA